MTQTIETALTPTIVTEDQVALVSRTIAKDLTPDELHLYLFMCRNEWQVHPLSKMIFPVKYKGKMTFLTSIDYLRARAGKTGVHAGTDDAVFSETAEGRATSASVTVYRLVGGLRCPFTATARLAEYRPTENAWMWDKMPQGQLAKCAEGLALRKAFPAELAKLYVPEEMDQAATRDATTPPPPAETDGPVRLITPAQLRRLHAIRGRAGVSEASLHTHLAAQAIGSAAEIPMAQYDTVVAWVERGGPGA